MLPPAIRIVGYARTKMSDAEYKDRVSGFFKLRKESDRRAANEFLQLCSYVSGNYDKDAGYIELATHVAGLEDEMQVKRRDRLFYLALPPAVFGQVSTHLRRNVYPGEQGTARVVIEKPFGHDLESSQALQRELAPVWHEHELYRIDHYLGKEMVKNILPFRFGNAAVFDRLWNKDAIASVQITFKEPFGTDGRGGYFDSIGIIRDVLQNHLLQVLSLVAMEPPATFSAEHVRDAKVALLERIEPIRVQDALVGQYGASKDGSKPGYLDDKTVPQGSRAATFAALHLRIANKRWAGVPFILSAGKALDEALVEIRVRFKKGSSSSSSNDLVLRVQPRESISLQVATKTPGLATDSTTAELVLPYASQFKDAHIPEAYESLLLDCLRGDHANFVRADELEVSWRLFTPLLQALEGAGAARPQEYAYGSNGPAGLQAWLRERGCSQERLPSRPDSKL